MPLTIRMVPVLYREDTPNAGKIRGFVPARRIDADLLAERKPKPLYKIIVSQIRSQKADGLYHKAIAVAADNWGDEEPNPRGDKEMLRAWLQCKAGPHWRKNIDFPWDARESATELLKHLLGDGKYAWVEEIEAPETEAGRKMRVFIPLSINHNDMDEEKFAPLRAGVIEILEAKFKCDVKEIVAEGEAVA